MTRKYKKRIRPKYKTEEEAILGARIKQREYQKKYMIKYP